jgi:hypothetical protein
MIFFVGRPESALGAHLQKVCSSLVMALLGVRGTASPCERLKPD